MTRHKRSFIINEKVLDFDKDIEDNREGSNEEDLASITKIVDFDNEYNKFQSALVVQVINRKSGMAYMYMRSSMCANALKKAIEEYFGLDGQYARLKTCDLNSYYYDKTMVIKASGRNFPWNDEIDKDFPVVKDKVTLALVMNCLLLNRTTNLRSNIANAASEAYVNSSFDRSALGLIMCQCPTVYGEDSYRPTDGKEPQIGHYHEVMNRIKIDDNYNCFMYITPPVTLGRIINSGMLKQDIKKAFEKNFIEEYGDLAKRFFEECRFQIIMDEIPHTSSYNGTEYAWNICVNVYVEPVKRYGIKQVYEGFAYDGYTRIQGLENYSKGEIIEIVKEYIEEVFDEEYIDDVEIIDIEIYGPRRNGTAKKNSMLNVAVEYSGDWREDDLFNILNDTRLKIDGIKVDINPITEYKSGTMAQYMRDYEKRDKEWF